MRAQTEFTAVDLFSGAGGMSSGFHAHPAFQVVGAADAEIGKPSTRPGSLGCNETYRRNIGVAPEQANLALIAPSDLAERLNLRGDLTALLACPPCTGFSRTLARNHLEDDARNSLVGRVADFAREFKPQVVMMENARELVMGRFQRHLQELTRGLEQAGYEVHASTHFLTRFGLPQKRERALVVAVRKGLRVLSMGDLWSGLRVNEKATHVRAAIWHLPAVEAGERDPNDRWHVSPAFHTDLNLRRLRATPHDGGGWAQWVGHADADVLLTPAMKERAARGRFGSHPDVYGRLWWDRPAATIKRESGHIGNGRYAHPEQDRLCTVRELAILQGFPANYDFAESSIANAYRHIGDAVPPLVSFQMAHLARWILTGERPEPESLVLPHTHLSADDVEVVRS
jgi:DNA (cytosine-5)-methyltransferase 1